LYDRILTKEKRPHVELSRMLLSLIPHPGKEAFKYPETDEYNITAAILRFLCGEIFNKEFYCHIGNREIESFMVSVETSMRNLEPRRDFIAYRTWRSETYAAIANRPGFDQLLTKRKDALTADLAAILGLFIPRYPMHKLQASVRNNIIEPAFALAHKMHLSVDNFSIEWSQYHDLRRDQRNHFIGEFKDVELVDLLAEGKTLKAHSSRNTVYIFDITPQLVFREVKADTYAGPKVLRKPRILVAVGKEGQGHNREPQLYPVPDATVLDWLDKTMMYLSAKRGATKW